MTTIFPAPPGTYLVERKPDEGRTEYTPVVGYYHVQGGIVFPLCAIAHGGLTRYRALLTPDGFVTDPSAGLVCASLEEWERIADTAGYEKLKVRNGHMPAAPAAEPESAGDEEEQTTDVQRQAERPAATADNAKPKPAPTRIPDKPKGKPQVFQTTSFWRVTGEGTIFTVEPGVEAPAKNDSSYTKIKRDDYQAMKREGADVIEWPLDADEAGSAASEPEDDEDDGSDLI